MTTNSWVSPNAITRSRSNGKTSPGGASSATPSSRFKDENSPVRSSTNRTMVVNHPIASLMTRSIEVEGSNLVESSTSRPDPFNMAPLSNEIAMESHQPDINMDEKTIPESSNSSSTPAINPGSSSSAVFLDPDEVSLPSISASLVPLNRGS